jgi:hypothetical protein
MWIRFGRAVAEESDPATGEMQRGRKEVVGRSGRSGKWEESWFG